MITIIHEKYKLVSLPSLVVNYKHSYIAEFR